MTDESIPFPKVCPDCFHDECVALVDAWLLLENDRKGTSND